MAADHIAVIRTESGTSLEVSLFREGLYDGAALQINGIWHHLERIPVTEIIENYVLDTDPDYEPKCDADGFCYLLVPFSR